MTKAFSIRLSEEYIEKLKRQSAKDGRSMANYLRKLLDEKESDAK